MGSDIDEPLPTPTNARPTGPWSNERATRRVALPRLRAAGSELDTPVGRDSRPPSGAPRHSAPHEAIWAPISLAAFLAARFVPWNRLDFLVCPFHLLTGFPCLSCGGTRAFVALAHFDAATAFAMNPLAAAAGLAGAAYVVHATGVGLGGWPPWRPRLASAPLRRALRGAVLVAVAGNWAYLIAVGR